MTTEKKKTNSKPIVAIIAAIVIYAVIQMIAFWFTLVKNIETALSQPETIKQELIDASNTINSRCPYMIDSYTQLDTTTPIEHYAFRYNYTLLGVSVREFDIEVFEAEMRPVITNQLRTDPSFNYFRDNNITMIYQYSDMNGRFILQIEVTPEDYLTDEEDYEEHDELILETVSI